MSLHDDYVFPATAAAWRRARPDRELLLMCRSVLADYQALRLVELGAGDSLAVADTNEYIADWQFRIDALCCAGRQLYLLPPD